MHSKWLLLVASGMLSNDWQTVILLITKYLHFLSKFSKAQHFPVRTKLGIAVCRSQSSVTETWPWLRWTVQWLYSSVQSLYSPVLAQTRPSPTDSGPVRGCIMSVRVATVSPGPIQTTWIFQGQDNHAPLTVSVSAATTEGLTNTRCTATAPWDLILTGWVE